NSQGVLPGQLSAQGLQTFQKVFPDVANFGEVEGDIQNGEAAWSGERLGTPFGGNAFKVGTLSEHSKTDWIRPGDLKTQEEYQIGERSLRNSPPGIWTGTQVLQKYAQEHRIADRSHSTHRSMDRSHMVRDEFLSEVPPAAKMFSRHLGASGRRRLLSCFYERGGFFSEGNYKRCGAISRRDGAVSDSGWAGAVSATIGAGRPGGYRGGPGVGS
ncbi:hypothetical protein Bbelb_150630, partial [Branchiostoma belcheri]